MIYPEQKVFVEDGYDGASPGGYEVAVQLPDFLVSMLGLNFQFYSGDDPDELLISYSEDDTVNDIKKKIIEALKEKSKVELPLEIIRLYSGPEGQQVELADPKAEMLVCLCDSQGGDSV